MKTHALLPFLCPRSHTRVLIFPIFKSCQHPPSQPALPSERQYSTTHQTVSGTGVDGAAGMQKARWLSDVKSRIGKCILFGLNAAQTRTTGTVLRVLGTEWRDLVAGREGFLVGQSRAGLLRHGVVWGEMDSMAHINNVNYTRYAESARINWAYNYAVHVDPQHKKEWSELWTPKGDGLILKSILTEFKLPMTWPDHVSVFHKLRSLPNQDDSGFVLDVMILSELHQRPAARCVEDIVVYDYRRGKKTSIRPFMMDAFRETWREQEAAKRRNIKRIDGLENIVRGLEKETWDRKDAVEEFGGPG